MHQEKLSELLIGVSFDVLKTNFFKVAPEVVLEAQIGTEADIW